MTPILYYTERSPPARAVLLTTKAIGLEIKLKNVNILEKDHLKPVYVNMNPQHTVPTLDDNGFIVWDSHAISAYLVENYAKDDSLYPKDLQNRATVDQRLHFDTGILFPRMKNIIGPILYSKQKTISAEDKEAMRESYDFIEKFLEGRTYIAGDQLTIADFSVLSSLTSIMPLVPPAQNLHNITKWMNTMKELPYYEEANGRGAEALTKLLKGMLT